MTHFHYHAAEGLLVFRQVSGVGSSACKGEVFAVAAAVRLSPIAKYGSQGWLMGGIAD